MDGKHTLDEAQKAFEKRFRPERLTLEDLEQFGQQLLTAGPGPERVAARPASSSSSAARSASACEWMQTLTNILYIKIPVFDPERLLDADAAATAAGCSRTWFLARQRRRSCSAPSCWCSRTSRRSTSKLPSYHEFFSFKTVVYLWVALGVVKVIHEFGHGLSCKAFGGEVHEMGMLFLCLSPAMYCNVSDAWTLPNKWHRIIISCGRHLRRADHRGHRHVRLVEHADASRSSTTWR